MPFADGRDVAYQARKLTLMIGNKVPFAAGRGAEYSARKLTVVNGDNVPTIAAPQAPTLFTITAENA